MHSVDVVADPVGSCKDLQFVVAAKDSQMKAPVQVYYNLEHQCRPAP